MSVSVVITASADRSEHLDRGLRSLARQRVRPAQVVVVQLGVVALTPPPIDGIDVAVVSSAATERGLALGAARNLGAAASDGAQLVFLDVDCLAADDLVQRYESVLAAHPAVLACGPVRYLREHWRADEPSGSGWDLLSLSDSHPVRPSPADGRFVEVNDRHELFWSLSFGVARGTWTTLGGFDEEFVGYGAEDTDLALRARDLGIGVAWFGGGIAFHQWHRPTRLDPARTAEIVANARRFRDRWGTWPMKGWLCELHDLGRVVFDERNDHLRTVES